LGGGQRPVLRVLPVLPAKLYINRKPGVIQHKILLVEKITVIAVMLDYFLQL